MKVFLLEGWFGDAEWREGVYATYEKAKEEYDRLWETRTSPNAPDWCQRLCKFSIDEVEVIEG